MWDTSVDRLPPAGVRHHRLEAHEMHQPPLLLMVAASLMGCANSRDHEDTSGTQADQDLNALLDSLPDCTVRTPDSRLDPVLGCADGLCLSDTFADAVAAFGPPDECRFTDEEKRSWWCEWPDDAVGVGFPGGPGPDDGQTSPADDATLDSMSVRWSWTGTTADGLGTGVSMACWLDRFMEQPELYMGSDGEFRGVWFNDGRVHVSNAYLDDDRDGYPAWGYAAYVAMTADSPDDLAR